VLFNHCLRNAKVLSNRSLYRLPNRGYMAAGRSFLPSVVGLQAGAIVGVVLTLSVVLVPTSAHSQPPWPPTSSFRVESGTADGGPRQSLAGGPINSTCEWVFVKVGASAPIQAWIAPWNATVIGNKSLGFTSYYWYSGVASSSEVEVQVPGGGYQVALFNPSFNLTVEMRFWLATEPCGWAGR